MATASARFPIVQQQTRIANILFATDFSPCSRRALRYAGMLANQHRATLHLANIVGPTPLVGPLGAPYADVEYEDEHALRELERLSEAPELKSVRHESSVHRGSVSEVLCRLVRTCDIDLVVMSTHGRHGVRHFVLGSVAEQVFRDAGCPVLTVGPGASPEGPATGRFSTILVALDLSSGSCKLLNFVQTLSADSGATLVLFHAVPEAPEASDSTTYTEDLISAARAQLVQLKPATGFRAEISIKIGPPAELILQAAEDFNADLIVVGAHRGMRLAARNPWAVAHEIVCGASCPVLTVGH